MNLNKTLSLAALLLATTALLSANSFATVLPKLNAPTYTVNNSTNYGTATAPIYLDSTASPLALTIVPGVDDAGGNCYYTTTGVAPTTASPVCPTSPILLPAVSGAKTAYKIEVLVAATGYTNNTATFNIVAESQISTPTFNPTTSTGATTVTISDTWASSGGAFATIKYTLDGSNPATSSTAKSITYKATSTPPGYPPFTIADNSAEVILTAVAESTGYINSIANAGTFGTSYGGGHNNFIAAGSSAQFSEYALAFGGVLGDGAGGACGGHHFTKSNGAQAADVRSGVTPADLGNLLIVWDNSADGTGAAYPSPAAPTKICVYVSLDSTLGVKAFMNSNLTVPGEFLNIVSSSGPSNSISPFWAVSGTNADESSIPADVLAAAQGQPFNVAVTDIRPEDAKFATTRALTTLNATRTGLGYGPGPLGTAIVSIAGTTFNVSDFALSGSDKISGAKQQPYTTVPIGAAPVLVIVNKTVAADGTTFHFSSSEVKNISRFTLAGYLNGTITGTGALASSTIAPLVSGPVNVWLREPLSGTYNTMEFNIPASKEIGSSQEIGVNPIIKGTCAGSTSALLSTCTGSADANGNSGNPMFIKVYPSAAGITTNPLGTVNSAGVMIGVAGATRQRAIGTGEEVKQVALTGADNLGYTFWGYGNIKSGNNNADTNTKYLAVDGVDPIYSEYSSGSVPTCTASSYSTSDGCPVTLTFPNVANGSYPIWSIYRAVIPNPAEPTTAQTNELAFLRTVLTAAEDASTTVQDFVPLTLMQVFRSHYTQAGVAPANGISSAAETGGDVGGAVYTIQADLDHLAQYGTEILNVKQ